MTPDTEAPEVPADRTRTMVREWLASLTDDQRREIEELHRTGRLEAALSRGLEKAVAARQIAAMCQDVFADMARTLTDSLRFLQPVRGR